MATRLLGAAALNPLFSPPPASSSSSSQCLSIPPRTPPSSSISSTARRLPPPSELVCRARRPYRFPDPIPAFAKAETGRFRDHMMKRLTQKKEYFGEHVEEIVDVCTEILEKFLSREYGGPGTLLVDPFAEMADAIEEQELPGGPRAARAAVAWAQNNIDKDWKEWTGRGD